MTTGSGRRPVVERAYAALIRLYPRSFRDEYGPDLVQLLRDQCADEPTWRVAARALADLVLTVPNQHLEARMHRTSDPTLTLTLAYAAGAAAGLALALVGGSNTATLVVGGAIAVVGATLAIATWRRAAPFRREDTTDVTRQWWKFLVSGTGLTGVVLLAAGLGLEAW